MNPLTDSSAIEIENDEIMAIIGLATTAISLITFNKQTNTVSGFIASFGIVVTAVSIIDIISINI